VSDVKGKESRQGKLWRLFHDKLIQLGIESNHAEWMVKWAEGFAKSMKGPLAERSPADLLRYFEKIAKRPSIWNPGGTAYLIITPILRFDSLIALSLRDY